jgi:hypothetical protein
LENRHCGERCNISYIPMKSAIIRAKTIGSCFLRGRREGGTWEQCGVENDYRLLKYYEREAAYRVDGTAGDGLAISAYIRIY